MGIFNFTYTDKCSIEKLDQVDDYGDKVYKKLFDIPCYTATKSILEHKEDRDILVYIEVYNIKYKDIQVGDKVNGRQVRSKKDIKTALGEYVHTQVTLNE